MDSTILLGSDGPGYWFGHAGGRQGTTEMRFPSGTNLFAAPDGEASLYLGCPRGFRGDDSVRGPFSRLFPARDPFPRLLGDRIPVGRLAVSLPHF